MYTITYARGVEDDFRNVPRNQRARILDQIELQLRYEPSRQTRNRKILVGLVPPWEHVEPVWELRVGGYRVFYDVDEAESDVIIRAVLHKPPHKQTGDIL